MSGVQTDCKVYVNVRAAFLPDGKCFQKNLPGKTERLIQLTAF